MQKQRFFVRAALCFGIECLGMSAVFAAQTCADNVISQPLAQESTFIDGDNVQLGPTVLQWTRCFEGYDIDVQGTSDTFTDDVCVENSSGTSDNTYTWQQALTLANTDPLKRLPNIKELLSIVNFSCSPLMVDTAAMPLLPQTGALDNTVVWSSTPAESLEGGRVFGVDIQTGLVTLINLQSTRASVLLVQ